MLVDEGFIECEYIITLPSLEYLASDRHTGGGDDRHISVEHELPEFAICDYERYLHDISTDTIGFSIANCCIVQYPFVRRVG